jgi:hypothetical protein
MSLNDTETIHEAQPIYAVSTAHWLDEPLIVQRSGRPAAVIISLEEYRQFTAWREERAARRSWVLARDPRQHTAADQWHAQFTAMDRLAERFANISDEELSDELTEALTAVRGESYHNKPR